MPYIEKLTFHESLGGVQEVFFLPKEFSSKKSHVTVITGKNGSRKSRVLGELVRTLIAQSETSKIELVGSSSPQQAFPVLCVSGAASDRFPPKESGGRSTEYDVPHYIYVGQRVGTNLLSKRLPLETVLLFALDPLLQGRFSWPFFKAAFDFAGLEPELEIVLHPRRRGRSLEEQIGTIDLFDYFLGLSEGNREGVQSKRPLVSQAVASHLIKCFDLECFKELSDFLRTKRPTRLKVSANAKESSSMKRNVARLGLMSDLLSLNEVNVSPNLGGDSFSAFELSSGEFHMLTTILAFGFACQNDAIILIDEPENSLHPQWQLDFITTSQEIFNKFNNLHVLISTHSPLIVSAVKSNSLVVDMENAQFQKSLEETNFGAASDRILFETFGVASSRNPYVADLIQRAIQATELGSDGEPVLKEMREDLLKVMDSLQKNDPLLEIIKALAETGDIDDSD